MREFAITPPRASVLMAVACLVLIGCGDSSGPEGTLDPDVPPITQGNWYRPGVDATWQWQLLGTVNVAYDVDVYDIDLFDVSAGVIASLQTSGKRVICYFSAGSFESFRSDASRFRQEELGNTLEGFADERWLDIRSLNVLQIMNDRLDLAVQKGCDGVEQLAFNRRIANAAHDRNLAVALKNDLDQISELLAYVDFAVNEQCHEFDECAQLQPFVMAGKPVFNAEYDNPLVTDGAERDRVCVAARAQDIRTLILPLDLDDAFRFSCDG